MEKPKQQLWQLLISIRDQNINGWPLNRVALGKHLTRQFAQDFQSHSVWRILTETGRQLLRHIVVRIKPHKPSAIFNVPHNRGCISIESGLDKLQYSHERHSHEAVLSESVRATTTA